MAPTRLSKKAPTALSSRQSPHPTSAQIATYTQANSSRTAVSRTSPENTLPAQPVVFRYERYQDDMQVKSTEGHEQGFTGMRHYTSLTKQQKLDTKPSLDHINYLSGDADLTDTNVPSEPDFLAPAYTNYPARPPLMNNYSQPIYAGTTRNPTVFLAILRIAQLNNPKMNFVSAFNHIPNIHPTEQLPKLTPSPPGALAPASFLDTRNTRPAHALRETDDEEISVAFLPYFYGKRHGVAFWEYVRDFKRGAVLGSACVTPCSEEDLRWYGLVEYIDPEDVEGVVGPVRPKGPEGVDLMNSVGVDAGRWLEKDIMEDWEEWRRVVRTCAVHWESRMALMRGMHEG
ncbi:hypothetical protein E8E12_000910 [Didymella heteroderae]|uniref:Uncharacterized protein n=1 Tax=Didymella heteroderae TaxID=1769908 RepID=A0A9P4WL70_9PLEO|nr:hypothetical protein E8E12_000910 [Didymella heteroderae]